MLIPALVGLPRWNKVQCAHVGKIVQLSATQEKKYIFMQLNAIFIPLKGQASFFTSSCCLLVKYVQVIFISYYYYFDLSEERGD